MYEPTKPVCQLNTCVGVLFTKAGFSIICQQDMIARDLQPNRLESEHQNGAAPAL